MSRKLVDTQPGEYARKCARIVVDFGFLTIRGFPGRWKNPWTFPSLGEYTSLLEKYGFQIRLGAHFDRKTRLQPPDDIRSWVKMFILPSFDKSLEEVPFLVDAIQERARPYLKDNEGWFADYTRLRVVATKES